MRYALEAAIRNVILPGESRPEGMAIHAILLRPGAVPEGRWFPDGAFVEDPDDRSDFRRLDHPGDVASKVGIAYS